MSSDRVFGLPLEFWTPGPLGMPFQLWSVAMTMTGLVVGSFLNVVIYRLPRNESVVTPPSHCPACNNRIPMRWNLPVLSWLILRGRARCCGARISPRYLVVEAFTGALFLATWLAYGRETPAVAFSLAAFWASLVASSAIDLEHFIVPDELSLGGTAVGVALSAFFPALHGVARAGEGMRKSAIGAVVGAGAVYLVVRGGKLLFGRERVALGEGGRALFLEDGLRLPDGDLPYGEIFYRRGDAVTAKAKRVELSTRCLRDVEVRLELLRQPPRLRLGEEVLNPEEEPWMAIQADEIYLPREAMGLGDVKLMAAIGAFLGWQATLFSLMASAMIGSVVGIGLIALGRRDWGARLPFGPFLALAALIWAFGGQTLVDLWLHSASGPR